VAAAAALVACSPAGASSPSSSGSSTSSPAAAVAGTAKTATIAGVTVLTNSKGFTPYSFAASIPVGRVGEPGDSARAYLYCLTQPFATRSILTVDGGTALA
jgi:hypothetical protein